ncbi:hypothetical protein ADU59_28375 [Pararhizobium polonicum]|uniref:Uncharacterized protein n=1 Tax=Pararhizobium polonicum TaxID=1612624 RepID=A0A1C7NT36_9HYPH|nr:hypothetical protein ADU59_28375 [Pararhizobium polonicum]
MTGHWSPPKLFLLDAIRDKNLDLADELAHARTRQFQDNFIRENYTADVALGPLRGAERDHDD